MGRHGDRGSQVPLGVVTTCRSRFRLGVIRGSVGVVAVAGTLSAVIVALFLRELRAKFRPPKLDINLSRENGRAVTAHLYLPGQAIPG